MPRDKKIQGCKLIQGFSTKERIKFIQGIENADLEKYFYYQEEIPYCRTEYKTKRDGQEVVVSKRTKMPLDLLPYFVGKEQIERVKEINKEIARKSNEKKKENKRAREETENENVGPKTQKQDVTPIAKSSTKTRESDVNPTPKNKKKFAKKILCIDGTYYPEEFVGQFTVIIDDYNEDNYKPYSYFFPVECVREFWQKYGSVEQWSEEILDECYETVVKRKKQ